MKYLVYFLRKFLWFLKAFFMRNVTVISYLLIFILIFAMEGYTLEDFGIDGFTLNPFDYCNLTDVDYTAVLQDEPGGNASVEITEYLTFDVHAASKYNPFKELWRELPEEYVDGVKVTYDVKSVSQVLDTGEEIPYTETSKMYWEDYDYNKFSTMYWHHSDGQGRYPDNDESLLIYIPWTYREKMTFKIVYTMNNAALKYNDCSELYLSMYSGNTIKKLNSFKAQILVPYKIMPTEYYAYTFGTSKARIPFEESDSLNTGYHTFSIDLDKSDLKFNYHNRYLEFCLLSYGDDKHIFTKYAPNNHYSHDDVLDECIAENEHYENQTVRLGIIKSGILIMSIICSYYIINNTIKKYNKIMEDHVFYKPEFDFKFFRDIPSDLDPIFASELVFSKDPFSLNLSKKEEYAAILLSLVRKKYVTITKINPNKAWSQENTNIYVPPLRKEQIDVSDEIAPPQYTYTKIFNSITGEELESLTTSEQLYYNLLTRHVRVSNITLKDLQSKISRDSSYTDLFVKDIEKLPTLQEGVAHGYFNDANYDVLKKKLTKEAETSTKIALIFFIISFILHFTPLDLCYGAFILLGIVHLARHIMLLEEASDSLLLTKYGTDEQAKWIGLYNFLNSETLMHEKEVHEVALWEKYLIYATAFGISEKVIKAIKINAPELNIDQSNVLNTNSYIHSSRFHSTSRSFGRSLHTSSRGGSFGRVSFGGHGYGGGGRGGGGGGGGH